MQKLVLVCGDLIVMARVDSAARKSGVEMVTVAAPGPAVAACNCDCRAVLIDLSIPGLDIEALVGELRQLPTPPAIVAFGPHVHELRLIEARQAGCDQVVTRGQLDRDVEAIVCEYYQAE